MMGGTCQQQLHIHTSNLCQTSTSSSVQPHWSTLQQQADVSDLAARLSCCDLLTAGLTVFDNRLETCIAWRSIFHNDNEDLNLKSSEQFDLLTNWLTESLQHALRITTVQVNNPEANL